MKTVFYRVKYRDNNGIEHICDELELNKAKSLFNYYYDLFSKYSDVKLLLVTQIEEEIKPEQLP